ncbi:hypothetical protein [Rossellomorea aquimaris]|uniref:Uncharacterized protein n=1 Tax=Rossellomorea aquimaris TaxID=189382 RepID=A0A1J6W3L1_9BACI|nr:hypothetical protein [Rossellomorea aquimaris]OIU72758.1 hypothetical protein BHE18_18460 [Rossellomorea aquimaris]
MDDKMFDKRMELLDRSYKKMPVQTDASDIIKAIREERNTVKNPRPLIHWPYAASFFGVLLIGTVLALQLTMGGEKTDDGEGQNRQATEQSHQNETLQAEMEDAEALYDLRKTQAMERLGFNEATFSTTQLDKDAKGHLVYVESIPKRDYTLEEKLDWVDRGKDWVEESLRTPDMMIRSLKDGITMVEAEVWTKEFMEKQTNLLPIYEAKLNEYKESWEPHIKNGEINMKSLNAPQPYPGEFRKMLDGIMNNAVGLTYNEREDTLETSINFEYFNMISGNALPEVYVSYMKARQSSVLKAGEFTKGWKEAGDRLIMLEQLLKELPEDSAFRNEVSRDFDLLFHYFVNGGVDQPIFSGNGKLKPEVQEAYEYVAETYPSYETGGKVKEVLQELSESDYMKPDRWVQYTPVIISSETEDIYENQ